ncbi:MAG: division/cell wall cluster transcriptional repressor MraZ [FCB group bacterium]|nr:division/cell wall cluster transcriptional repressor MraZ [FCB group bacterium]
MLGFCGTFDCVIDDKSRLSIPSRIRPGDQDSSRKKGIPAGETMVLTQGLDGCLSLYPEEEWAKIQNRLETLSFTRKDFRYFNRRLHQHTSLVRIDKSGRIHIPDILRQLAGINKNVLVIGANQTIEIWDPDRHQAYLDNFDRTIEEVAERLFHNDSDQ